ncbi:hypothetical protein K474DRAFT_1610439 [Panus rudis PR-1116 ss-1]|nr:hypothetical protein K474DRAFT_1610439 [Panus rudis PR-1116 ss-1]
MHREFTAEELTEYLLGIGAEFRTLTARSVVADHAASLGLGDRENPHSLGFRAKGFKGDVDDFKAYYLRLKDFFKKPYVTHAALRKGGIIWRITYWVLQDNHSHCEDVGHTSDLLSHGELLQGDGGIYVDENLSKDEEDLIVGTYKVYTDVGPDQAADCSWWPNYSVWRTCSYGAAGYWTPKCEAFFQGRVNDILAGKSGVGVKTSKDWKKSLRRARLAPDVFKRIELGSEAFIQKMYST